MSVRLRLMPLLLATSISVGILTACVNQPEGVYRGGILLTPGPLTLNDHYEFTFLDRWRISHAWVMGPTDIFFCKYSRRDSGRGHDRFIEISGVLHRERVSGSKKDYGQKYISRSDEMTYGTNTRTGVFQGYDAFCTHTFQDIWTGISVFLMKPDPDKGTDDWVAGAWPVKVNGLQWLRQVAPPADYSRNRERWAAPIETWTLKIPDTPYWLVMRLGGSTGGAGKAPGINRNPAKFEEVKAIFHRMVESVRLTPL